MVDIVPIPAFKDNYIWAICQGDQIAVVDPGDAAPVLDFLDGRSLSAILVTHHHHDHVGGLAALRASCSGRETIVFGPAAESITGVTHPLSGGEHISLPGIGLSLAVMSVPGHTRGHLAYYGGGSLFCGDTLFGGGCGRLFEGSPAQMHASLSSLAALPPETLAYCAHEYTAQNLRFAKLVEPHNAALTARIAEVAERRSRGIPTVPFTLAGEQATNPFLRCDAPVVAAAVRDKARGDDPLAVFTALRAWRNEF